MFQESSSFKKEEISLLPEYTGSDDMTLSTSVLYNIHEVGSPCLGSHCIFTQIVKVAYKPCTFNLVCSKLDGHICGDYGVIAQHLPQVNGSIAGSVCSVGQVVSYDVVPGDFIELSLWTTSQTGHNDYNCHFWCTRNGSLPFIPATNSLPIDEVITA